ncbi:ankyrin repeat-containing domain protein [Aspergillus pseudoustus]|uniref:Ankyrin repeat-containing domain protein n=1 Tax=Aspergillus pseudoustus TaxID=1810923 RepID=A0ABR4JBB7_9EURO
MPGKICSSASIQAGCQDAVQDFFNRLTTDEKILFQATDKSEQLINDLVDLDEKHKVSVSRKIVPNLQAFVTGVDRYAGAMDVISSTVSMMSPIWGCCRVVLQIAKEYSEYFDKLSEMFEEIGYNLTCLRRYPRLYPDNDVLKESMVDIFQAIVEFCVKAREVFQQGKKEHSTPRVFNSIGLRATWKLVWKPFKVQFGGIIDRVKSSMSRIEHEVDLAEKELASASRAKADGERKLQAARWDTLLNRQELAQMNQWLAPANAVVNHNAATKLRHQGTGTWFIDGEPFKKWVSTDHSFLWLHAIPGGGKTILASTIIDWIRQRKERAGVGLTYFYCDYKDKQKQSPTRIISTILSMIANKNEDIFRRIYGFFEEQLKENPAYTPEFDELLNNFADFVGDSLDELYIVVDALDETEDRECVAYAFKKISETCKCARLLVTSRHEIDIARAFEGANSTSIAPGDIADDLELYIRSEVGAKIKAKKLKLRDPGLQDSICERLIEGAHGMFQWVKCQIDQLCRLRNDRAIRTALDDLPKTLHDTYIRILRKLEAECADEVESVQRLLRWLVRGTRNLTLDELAECVSIDPASNEEAFDFDSVFTDPEDVIELCGSLVITSSDGTVSLAHYTVKEFLVSDHIKGLMPTFFVGCSDVHAELASVCLTYLCYEDFSALPDDPVETLLQTHAPYKFLRYAVQSWGAHAHLSEGDETVFNLTMRLLRSENDSRGNYILWRHMYRYLHKATGQRSKIPSISPLYFASLFGLPEAVSSLLEEDPESDNVEAMKAASSAGHDAVVKVFLDQRTPIESTLLEQCLYEASAAGRDEVVTLLLGSGVDVNASGGKHGTALQVAALEGRQNVVSTLLERGADKEVTCQRYGRPLAAAAEKCHIHTVKTLLDHGAKINGRGGWHGFPLISAIVAKNMQLVDIFIGRGADVNALGGRYGCPLMAAASMNMLDLIRSLVGHGARVNDENDKGSDALYAACIGGHLDAVELLLCLGADVNAKGGKHRNALNAASATGNIEIVKCLIASGADVDFFDEHYGNSIQVAAAAGHDEVVRILADAGVDVNAPSGDRGTALISAAQNGHTKTVQLLFKLGVPSGHTYEMTNALMVTARKGFSKTVQLLVGEGACMDDVSTLATYPKCTALEAAADKSHLETVKLLLDLGADVNYENEGEYGTPLIAAILSDKPYTHVIAALLDAGANVKATVNAAACAGGCALGAAIFRRNSDLCLDLIRRGAEVNETNGLYYNCLQLVMRYADEQFVDLLVDNGADINLAIEPSDDEEQDDGTVDALQTAVLYASKEMVQKLINMGADLHVEVPGARYTSPLQVASVRDDPLIVRMLLDKGCDVNATGGLYGSSLQAAAHFDCLEAARILLDAGADVDVAKAGSKGSAIMAASVAGHTELVQLLIQNKANVNLTDDTTYNYPLQAAAYHGHDGIVEALIAAGADPNRVGGICGTALQAAAKRGEFDICRVLLEAGADPNIISGRYGTALAAAYSEGFYEVIHLLYERGACHSLQGGEYGSALGAALGGSCQTLVITLLRRHHADPNLAIRKYGSPLQAYICSRRADDVFATLLELGANVNAHGGLYGTPLIAAAAHGDEEEASAFLDAGAQVNMYGTVYHPTALHSAIQSGNLSLVKLFVEHGADIHIKDSFHGPPLEYAASLAELRIVRYLLALGADINTNSTGRYHNVMQAAAISGHETTIRYLVNRGAELHERGGKYGSTLVASVLSGDPDTVELLLKHGVNVNTRGGIFGYALQAAAARGSISLVLLLLRYGADINVQGGKYGTALQAACAFGDYELVQLLIERGANVNTSGGLCRTALQAAALFGHDYLCELLMKNGATWSLADRNLLHFTASRLDNADEILQAAWEAQENGWPETEGSDAEWTDEDEQSQSDTDDEILTLNVESIPLFDESHRPLVEINQPRAQSTGVNTLVAKEPVVAVAEGEPWTALDWLQVECGAGGDFA